uniref:Microcephalin n=1 Tax=Loa loa TaxID=7209 RepID=A0A1I7VDX3_LOALO
MILGGVRAFVDVRLEKTSILRQMLRDLGATVNLRFSKNITHLIFWNGRQETLDKAHHLGIEILILSPHWVFNCFMNQIRADEAPFLLYGIKDLAIPMRLMAMGRMGTVNMDKALNSSGSSPNQSQIVHAIETLSDQLASKFVFPANNENIDVVEIISPIVDRVRKRINELNYCRVSRKQRRHTRVSMFPGESEQQFATPPAENSSLTKSVNVVEITQSEPVKKRGRPTVNSEQLAEYTPTRFHRFLQRRYRSVKAGHAAQLNTEKMVSMYRKMMNQNFSEISADDRKLSAKDLEKTSKTRPLVVRTRSSVLNELQNVPSSNEFMKKKKLPRKRIKTGNIILSGISKIEKETVFAITKKLGLLKIASTVDELTRYVVSDQEGVRTVNVMRALVKGIPIVTVEWAYRSLEIGGWLKGNDFFVPRWKTAHEAWLNGRMAHLFSTLGPFYVSSKCEPEAKHLSYLIKCCHGKTTESLSRAVIFVAPQSEWRTFMQLRKDTDTQATYITEKSLLVGRLMEADLLEVSCQKANLIDREFHWYLLHRDRYAAVSWVYRTTADISTDYTPQHIRSCHRHQRRGHLSLYRFIKFVAATTASRWRLTQQQLWQ